MTDDKMNLRTLVEKDPRRRSVARDDRLAAQRLMELEVGGQTGAAYGEKNPERLPSATVTRRDLGDPRRLNG